MDLLQWFIFFLTKSLQVVLLHLHGQGHWIRELREINLLLKKKCFKSTVS